MGAKSAITDAPGLHLMRAQLRRLSLFCLIISGVDYDLRRVELFKNGFKKTYAATNYGIMEQYTSSRSPGLMNYYFTGKKDTFSNTIVT